MEDGRQKILEWLGGNDTGQSSKAIALTALGAMPKSPSYPSDGNDFGRCYRLLKSCPDATRGLTRLASDGGTIWKLLIARWSEIEAAYLHDEKLIAAGDRNGKKFKCYDLMKSIIHPIEDASGTVVRVGDRMSIHFGKRP